MMKHQSILSDGRTYDEQTFVATGTEFGKFMWHAKSNVAALLPSNEAEFPGTHYF